MFIQVSLIRRSEMSYNVWKIISLSIIACYVVVLIWLLCQRWCHYFLQICQLSYKYVHAALDQIVANWELCANCGLRRPRHVCLPFRSDSTMYDFNDSTDTLKF